MVSTSGPLLGVRVVDACDESGRWAAKLLADAGADVVRVRRGLPGPPLGAAGGGHGALEWWLDGGTRFVDAAPGTEDFARLVARADILLETEPPGRLPDAPLRAANPALVHIALTPFGQDGPWAGWRTSDVVAAALGGVLSVNGLPDEPLPIWGRQSYTVGGLYAASAALAGLVAARAGGGGLYVDLSLHQAVMACTEHLFMFWWHPQALAPFGAPVAVRQGSLHWVRGYAVMACARGACMVSPTAGGVFDLIAWMQSKGFGTDLPARPAPGEMLAMVERYMAALRALAATEDATELFERGQAMHVPFGEVLTVAQVVRSEQVVARGALRPVPGADERLRIPGPMARFSATPLGPPAPPPTDGTAVAEVLAGWPERHPAPPQAAAGQVAAGPAAAGPAGPEPVDRRPLAGLRVVDFTHVLAGPFATRLFGDLGADVVKIQTTDRAQGGSANDFPYFPMWNRNKRSLALDMHAPGALEVFRRLVEQADVVIDNFSAGVLAQWGCPHEVLASWNPRIISISMTGCGEDGPWRDHVTYAPTVHALCGLTALTGPAGRMDVGTGIALNDHTSGLLGAFAVLAALEARSRSGVGQHIDLSQLETGAMLVAPALIEHLATGREPVAGGLVDPFDPAEEHLVLRAADGEWLAATVAAGPAGDAARARVHEVAAGHGARDAMVILQGEKIAAGAVQRAQDLTELDPQLAHRDAFLALDSPLWGTQHTDRYPGVLHHGDGAPIELRYRHAPYFGEHTFEVATELLGLDDAVVAEAMGSGLFS